MVEKELSKKYWIFVFFAYFSFTPIYNVSNFVDDAASPFSFPLCLSIAIKTFFGRSNWLKWYSEEIVVLWEVEKSKWIRSSMKLLHLDAERNFRYIFERFYIDSFNRKTLIVYDVNATPWPWKICNYAYCTPSPMNNTLKLHKQ